MGPWLRNQRKRKFRDIAPVLSSGPVYFQFSSPFPAGCYLWGIWLYLDGRNRKGELIPAHRTYSHCCWPTPACTAATGIPKRVDLAFRAPLKASSLAPCRETKAILAVLHIPLLPADTSIFLLLLRIPLATDKHHKLQLPHRPSHTRMLENEMKLGGLPPWA